MKKRIARIVVYFALAGFAGLVLSHPYVWQHAFGPRIKGEPLWAWQQEFLYQRGQDPTKATAWRKLLALVKLDSKPMQWIGAFPADDPEMIPVLLSLADDKDDHVRTHVAFALARMPADDKVIEKMTTMLDDPEQQVRYQAFMTLTRHGPASAVAAPKLQALIKTSRGQEQLHAAVALACIDAKFVEANQVVRAAIKSEITLENRIAYDGINASYLTDEEIFALILDRSIKSPDFPHQCDSTRALAKFGKKAVPHLVKRIRETAIGDLPYILATLRDLGPEAKDAVPELEKLASHRDTWIQIEANQALRAIDPKRFADK